MIGHANTSCTAPPAIGNSENAGRTRNSGCAASHWSDSVRRQRTVAVAVSGRAPVTGKIREICSGVAGPSCVSGPTGKRAPALVGALLSGAAVVDPTCAGLHATGVGVEPASPGGVEAPPSPPPPQP